MKFPGPRIRVAHAAINKGKLELSNNVISMSWRIEAFKLVPVMLINRITGESLKLPKEAFSVVLEGEDGFSSSEMNVTGDACVKDLTQNKSTTRKSESYTGKQIEVSLALEDKSAEVVWRGILRDGSNYIRQEFTFKAGRRDMPLKEVVLLDMFVPDGTRRGDTQGSIVVTDTMFFGYEHPMAVNASDIESTEQDGSSPDDSTSHAERRIRCSYRQDIVISAGQSYSGSCVIGIVPKGQLRRGFLYYLERERVHPYRQFLHYNSWYDIGFFSKYSESDCLRVIENYGRELVLKRGVKLDSFMFDDGWDDTSTLWDFHKGFPHGFVSLKSAAAEIGAEPGVWLSPWGGYGNPRKERIKYGRQQGYEIQVNIEEPLFKLSGKKYYKCFQAICMHMACEYGINHFKFDGIGDAGGYGAGDFVKDYEKVLQLIHELRGVKKDIYINLTTGTWPSPFWLFFVDSVWRGGLDHSFAGEGTQRQKWITYRDGETYENVVLRSPLFPLNSLMLHGIIFARHARGLEAATDEDFIAEVRSGFGSGTQLQELYITPEFMTDKKWDELARSASWAKRNAAILADTHWIGGNPNKLEIYGWASWSPEGAVLVLRNPSGKRRQIRLDAAKVFELPENAPKIYLLRSPYTDQRVDNILLKAEEGYQIKLEPFEVLVFDTQAQ